VRGQRHCSPVPKRNDGHSTGIATATPFRHQHISSASVRCTRSRHVLLRLKAARSPQAVHFRTVDNWQWASTPADSYPTDFPSRTTLRGDVDEWYGSGRWWLVHGALQGLRTGN